MKRYLKTKGYKAIKHTEDYLIAEGDIPIILCAHADTIAELYNGAYLGALYDKKQDIFHVLGGCTLDDRLGIYGIMKIIERGYRPHVLITTAEESGCLGAGELITRFPHCPFRNVKFIIELDRQGEKDCVFYSCGNNIFKKYIQTFGFEEAQGTYTDCKVIGEAWDIAAVNFSIGYLYEHSAVEYGRLEWTQNTIDRVCYILDDCSNVVPFKYMCKKSYVVFPF